MQKAFVLILISMVVFAWVGPAHAHPLISSSKQTGVILAMCGKNLEIRSTVQVEVADQSVHLSDSHGEHSHHGHSHTHSTCHDCKTCSCFVAAVPSLLIVQVPAPQGHSELYYPENLTHPFLPLPYQPPRI